MALAFDATGSRLAVITSQGLKILATRSGRQLRFYPGFVEEVVFRAEQDCLVVAGRWGLPDNKAPQNTVSVCALPNGTKVGGITYKFNTPLRWLSPRGDLVAVVQGVPAELLWQDPLDGRILDKSVSVPPCHAGAFSGDGKRLALLNRNTATIAVWDVPSRKLVRTLDVKPAPGHLLYSSRVFINVAGDRVAVAYLDPTADSRGPIRPARGPIKVFDVATGSVTLTLQPHARPLGDLAFCPSGQRLATVAGDRTIVVWDLATGRERLTFRVDSENIRWLAFSPDGRRLAAADTKMIWMWDTSLT
jgi:WD40 repeat protein